VEEDLARVPFTREEEQTIASMARWMRFMAVVGIVGALLLLFFAVLGVGLLSAVWGLGESSPEGAERRRVLADAAPWLSLLLAAVLVTAAAALWQNFALYRASDYFNLVARTDLADLDYLARGLDRLRVFFKVQVLIVVVTVVVAFGAALAVLAVTRHA
jgi:hypothetical protein